MQSVRINSSNDDSDFRASLQCTLIFKPPEKGQILSSRQQKGQTSALLSFFMNNHVSFCKIVLLVFSRLGDGFTPVRAINCAKTGFFGSCQSKMLANMIKTIPQRFIVLKLQINIMSIFAHGAIARKRK